MIMMIIWLKKNIIFYLKNDDYGPAGESQGRCGGEQYVLHLQVLAHL